MATTRKLLSACTALTLAAAPAAAGAASVRLHVQAPYDIQNKTFNLESLEYQNLMALFSRHFDVPYDTLEPLLDQMLEDAVGRHHEFYIKCTGLGIDELCPDTEVDVYLHSKFRFTKKNQPVITQLGPAKDNKFRVALDTQARISLDAAIHHETGIWYSGSETVDFWVLIGARASVDLTLWPIPKAENLKIELKKDGGDVDIDGLEEQIIVAGTVVGGIALGPLGAALGAILGAIGADAANDAIVDAIEDALADQINAANVQLREYVQGLIDPVIAQAVDYRQKALSTKIPKLDLTVAEALAISPASLDVRTFVKNNEVAVAATTRFDPTGKGKSIQGFIRFPKTKCNYMEGGNKTVGKFKIPTEVVPMNADLAGKSCASVINAATFARSTYLGESPNRVLHSGDPANTLPSWQSTGTVSTSGNVVDKADYYECAYSLNNLPNAAILELATVKDSALHERLDLGVFRGRYLFAAALSPMKLFDAEGKPLVPGALVFGGKGPKTVDDCPSYAGGGSGLRPNKEQQLKDKFDPEKCPTCGLLDVFNHLDLVSNPAEKVILESVPDKTSIAQKADQVQQQFASQGALAGLQRIQKVLDSGVVARTWAAVDKGRAKTGKLSPKGVTVKQLGGAVMRKRTVKVFDGTKALKVNSVRVKDSALPKAKVEVLVTKGKQAGH